MTSNNVVTTGNNEKSFVGYQSDRFEQTQNNKSCDTMKEKKLDLRKTENRKQFNQKQ